ncbi:c-type cytochrome [Sphaerotilus uruguayifluvii]|uniref:Cytochrome c n=1 Tax=Sphaerotilus uruguayifluvii TaxID=2735897 RepID=A0ABX2G8G9_9BURK|nr:cytochrome C' [Leptothrix sp. C29]NRT58319.1 cytochrome c [Leptothrix sp. C29]
MKSLLALAALTAAATLAAPAFAADAPADLASKKGCLACHAIDKKLVGPAYQEVAAKLADKVVKGGSGVWGPVPMPANNVTPEEAKTLVAWVLSQK